MNAVDAAIQAARAVTDRPSLICASTVIGKGAPTKGGTAEAHGSALGAKEVAATRAAIGWDLPPFEIPDDVYAGWDAREAGALRFATWEARFAAYKAAFPELAREFDRRMQGDLPASFTATGAAFVAAQADKGESIATRKASQQAIEAFANSFPSCSADPPT